MSLDATGGPVEVVVFDVGNVLMRWDPRFLFRKLLPDDAAVERFLADVCPQSWNVMQDAGRPWAEGVAEAIARHPDQADLIRAYDARWLETAPEAIEASVAVLRELKRSGRPVYAITNFSAEKWVVAKAAHDFLDLFDGAVVSAHERVIKPDPKIFQILFDRYGVDPGRAVFIDDSARNVAASEALGMRGLLFHDRLDLRASLRALGVRF